MSKIVSTAIGLLLIPQFIVGPALAGEQVPFQEQAMAVPGTQHTRSLSPQGAIATDQVLRYAFAAMPGLMPKGPAGWGILVSAGLLAMGMVWNRFGPSPIGNDPGKKVHFLISRSDRLMKQLVAVECALRAMSRLGLPPESKDDFLMMISELESAASVFDDWRIEAEESPTDLSVRRAVDGVHDVILETLLSADRFMQRYEKVIDGYHYFFGSPILLKEFRILLGQAAEALHPGLTTDVPAFTSALLITDLMSFAFDRGESTIERFLRHSA